MFAPIQMKNFRIIQPIQIFTKSNQIYNKWMGHSIKYNTLYMCPGSECMFLGTIWWCWEIHTENRRIIQVVLLLCLVEPRIYWEKSKCGAYAKEWKETLWLLLSIWSSNGKNCLPETFSLEFGITGAVRLFLTMKSD